jgi:hypothetical protein
MSSATTAPAEQADVAATPAVTLPQYLAALYPAGTPGDLLAYSKDPFARRFGIAANLDAFARQILALDGQGGDVYLTVNTLDGNAIRRRGSHTRGTEGEVVAVVALVADVDAEKPGHSYPPQARILQSLDDMPLAPSMIVVSGKADGGLHPYWLLRDPFVIQNDADRTRIKSISERWQRLLKAKLAPFDLDSTFDLVRVLRPIGTTNHKYGTTVSAMLFEPGRRYRVEDFEQHLPAPPAQRPVAYRPIIADHNSVMGRAQAYLAKLPGAIAGQGGHDSTFRAACILIEGFGLSVDDAFPLLAEWNVTCQPPWTERDLRHKLESADARAANRGHMLVDSPAVSSSGVNIDRLVLAGATR